MARRFFKRYLPDRTKVHSDRTLAWLRPVLNKPYLWHLNRHCVCRGLAVGMFWAWIPIPMQSVLAVPCVVPFRGNLAVAYAATWVSNIFTLLPHWWLAYTIGTMIVGKGDTNIEFTWDFWKDKYYDFGWLWGHFWDFYLPLTLGSLVMSVVSAGLCYVGLNFIWRSYTRYRWQRRREKMAAKAAG